uniref:Uncharacterized protein n=1 Tax=Anopheles minimus TaxID=112268 RepID=A0A182VRR6_9DIPT
MICKIVGKNLLRKRIDIFCSTSVRSSARQKSSNEILPPPTVSASMIVRSAMLFSWSWLMFAPTIICRMLSSSSREIVSSSSRSYILNAKRSFSSRLFSRFSLFGLIGRK